MKQSKRVLLAMALLIIAVMLSGCTLFSQKSGSVKGIVTMGDGETPIKADVFIDGKKIVTANDKGEFVILLKTGNYKIHAEYLGKTSTPSSIEITNGNVLEKQIKVSGLGILSGKIITENDKAIEGAEIKLGTIKAVTDKDGKYTMVVAPGKQDLTINYKGYVFTETYEMPESDEKKDIKITDLKAVTLAVKKLDGTSQKELEVDVIAGDYKNTVKTDDKGSITLIAPINAKVSAKLIIPHTTATITSAKDVILGTDTEVILDVEEKLLFRDDFSSDKGNYEFIGTEIADGTLKRTADAAGRATAWLKTDKIGASDNYIVVAKALGGGAAWRLNAAVPDDYDYQGKVDNLVFYGYQNPANTSGSQFSCFHGPNGPSGGPFWGWQRDLDFNNKLVNADGKETHPILELKEAKQVKGEENVCAIMLERVDGGREVSMWFDGVHQFTILDSETTVHEYPDPIGERSYFHQGGGVVLVLDPPKDDDNPSSIFTSLEIYKI